MKNVTCLVLMLLPFASATVVAQQQQQQQQQPPQQQSQQQPPPPSAARPAPSAAAGRMEADVQFSDLIASVERRTGRRFLVHETVPPQIYLGGIEVDDVDYPQLLLILRNYDLLAMESDGWVNIVPPHNARTMPMRVVGVDTPEVPRDEVVTLVVATRNVEAAQLVPVLRPMVSQWGHLAAAGSTSDGRPPSTLLIVDRYANAMRIAELIRQLDR